MKFGDVRIQNFLSIKEAFLNLSNRGLVLIEGVNTDDPSARSNGAGKSSIVDALSWCLYGKTARGVTGGDVVNRQAGKDCRVEVCIIDDSKDVDEFYFVTRERKVSNSGSLEIKKLGPSSDGSSVFTELTKGTMAESQKTIEEIIGCPYEVFVSAVYAGQEAMPDIPNMTDKQLKELIESVIGVEKLTNAYQKVLAESNEIDKKHTEKGADLMVSETAIGLAEDACINTQRRIDEWTDEAKAELDRSEKDLNDTTEQLKKAESELSALKAQKEEAEEAIAKLDEKLNIVAKLDKKLQAQRDHIAQLQTNFRVAENVLNNAQSNWEAATVEEKNIESRIGTKCSECGKIYTKDDLEEASKQAHSKTLKKAQELDQKRSEYDSAKEAYYGAETAFKSVLEAIPDTRSLYEQKEAETQKIRAFERKKFDMDVLQADLKRKLEAFKKAESVLSAGNPYIAQYEEETKKLEALKEEHEKVVSEAAELEEQVEVYKELKRVFGKEGVRQHVLDTITPILNEKTARYLNALSDGKLSAIWTTLSMTKKGEVKENFNIKVSNSVGGNSFASLSGGEKRKVRVACCLALQELVASRATKPIELFVADEVDHALDDAGVERLIAVLNEKAETCKTLLVISHNPLRNWIDNVIQVVKKDGYSTIG